MARMAKWSLGNFKKGAQRNLTRWMDVPRAGRTDAPER